MFIFVSFIKLGKFLAIISLNTLSAPFFSAWDSHSVYRRWLQSFSIGWQSVQPQEKAQADARVTTAKVLWGEASPRVRRLGVSDSVW